MTLDLKDFSGLLVGGHVLVNEADAAFLSDGDGERASVTVSITAETIGMLIRRLRVSCVASWVSRGRTSE